MQDMMPVLLSFHLFLQALSKVVKGGTKVAKGLGEVSSTRKGLKNADAIAEGWKFEADELKRAIGSGKNVSSQTRLVPKMERKTLRVLLW